MATDEKLIWYAAYGSNLRRERFLGYLRGGSPSGVTWHHVGCRDRRDPRADQPVQLNAALYFADIGSKWWGGVAFIDPNGVGRTVLARAYLITEQQFADVLRQENGEHPGKTRLDVDIRRAIAEGHTYLRAENRQHAAPDLPYSRVIKVGNLDNAPMLTFTSRSSMASRVLQAPSPEYLATIVRGLIQTYSHHTEDRICEYLAAAEGVSLAYDAAALRRIVAASRGSSD